jgi:hypothetical protein
LAGPAVPQEYAAGVKAINRRVQLTGFFLF